MRISILIFSNLHSKYCNGEKILNEETIELLHERSRIVHRKVVYVDWKNSKVFLQDKLEDKDEGKKFLSKQDLNELKRKSFVPPNRKVVKIDLNEDIIYYEK